MEAVASEVKLDVEGRELACEIADVVEEVEEDEVPAAVAVEEGLDD